jgi:hypothetical protein
MRTWDGLVVRPRGEHPVAGSDPPKPEYGVAPGHKFFPCVRIAGGVHGVCPSAFKRLRGQKRNRVRNHWWNEHFHG